MKTLKPVLVILISSLIQSALPAMADDGVVHQDQVRVEQDKKDLRQDNLDIKTAESNIVQDKASGNTVQLQKDRQALKEARRNRHQAKLRLAQDRAQKHHDSVHP